MTKRIKKSLYSISCKNLCTQLASHIYLYKTYYKIKNHEIN